MTRRKGTTGWFDANTAHSTAARCPCPGNLVARAGGDAERTVPARTGAIGTRAEAGRSRWLLNGTTPGHGCLVIVLIGEGKAVVCAGNLGNRHLLRGHAGRKLTTGRGEYDVAANTCWREPVQIPRHAFAYRDCAGIGSIAIERTNA